jgi:hypothetical protein
MSYKLKFPIGDIEEVGIKKIVAGDLKSFSAKPTLSEIASVALEDKSVFDELDGKDIVGITELVGIQLEKEIEIYANEDGLQTIDLEAPLVHGKDTYNSLSFRRIKGKDLKKLSGEPSFSDLLRVGGRLCGLSYSEISRLDACYGVKVVEIVGDFL